MVEVPTRAPLLGRNVLFGVLYTREPSWLAAGHPSLSSQLRNHLSAHGQLLPCLHIRSRCYDDALLLQDGQYFEPDQKYVMTVLYLANHIFHYEAYR